MIKALLLTAVLSATACSQRQASSPDSTYVFSAAERTPTPQQTMDAQDRAVMNSRAQMDRERAEARARADEADEKREAAVDAAEAAEDPATRAEHEKGRAETEKALEAGICATLIRDPSNPYDHGHPRPGCEGAAP
ncbi:MAG TPA: hypothetical protein VK745_24495 [Polyangiaceae bacterium]|jgi:hypothetical protein|nr:hypothetical protein [Polyangiaceae bacterium]